jgi:hypothetical protein
LEAYHPHIEIVVLDSISSFNYFLKTIGQSKWPIAKKEKRKHKTWEVAHLMNKRDFWRMIFWLVLKLEISYRVIIS